MDLPKKTKSIFVKGMIFYEKHIFASGNSYFLWFVHNIFNLFVPTFFTNYNQSKENPIEKTK